HGDVRLPLFELAKGHHAHDSRVMQTGKDASLSVKSRLFAGIDARQGDHLERDRLAADFVPGSVHDTHAAASDLALDDEAPRQQLGLRRLRHAHARFSSPTTKSSML